MSKAIRRRARKSEDPQPKQVDQPQVAAPQQASPAPRAMVAPVPVPPMAADMNRPFRVADTYTPARRGRGPLCSICNAPMRNDGVRKTAHRFRVEIRYACTKDDCPNTTLVKEWRR